MCNKHVWSSSERNKQTSPQIQGCPLWRETCFRDVGIAPQPLRKSLLLWVTPAGEFWSSCNLSSIAWKWQTSNFANPIREQNHRIFQQVRKWSCKYQPRLFPITTVGGKKRPWFCVIQSGQNYHTQQAWRLQRKIRKRRLGSSVQHGSCGSPSYIIFRNQAYFKHEFTTLEFIMIVDLPLFAQK